MSRTICNGAQLLIPSCWLSKLVRQRVESLPERPRYYHPRRNPVLRPRSAQQVLSEHESALLPEMVVGHPRGWFVCSYRCGRPATSWPARGAPARGGGGSARARIRRAAQPAQLAGDRGLRGAIRRTRDAPRQTPIPGLRICPWGYASPLAGCYDQRWRQGLAGRGRGRLRRVFSLQLQSCDDSCRRHALRSYGALDLRFVLRRCR